MGLLRRLGLLAGVEPCLGATQYTRQFSSGGAVACLIRSGLPDVILNKRIFFAGHYLLFCTLSIFSVYIR
jgi:hypothetical protein